MSFSNQQPKNSAFFSVHFLNNSQDNLVKNSGKNNFYHLPIRLDYCKNNDL